MMLWCDLVITAEGRYDETSACHKGPWGVAQRAARFGVPTVLVAGSVAAGTEGLVGQPFAAVFPLEQNLGATAARALRLFPF